jgi:hypothetical protein
MLLENRSMVDVTVRRKSPRLRAVLMVMALLLGGGLLVQAATPVHHTAAASDGWIDTDVLNLRDGPGTYASVVDMMRQGEYVAVLDGPTNDGWYRVEYAGTVGWAFGSYLSVGGSAGWNGGGASAERWVDVDRGSGSVTLYEGNTPVGTYYGSFGWDQSSDGFYATANGTFYVYSMNRDIAWTEWGQAYIKFWVGFDPSRYNGFHSYSLDGYGNVLPNGDGATGGCVALPLWAAEIVYDFASIGTRVEVHW